MRLLILGAAVVRLGIVGVGQDEPVSKLLPQIEERLARVPNVEIVAVVGAETQATEPPAESPKWVMEEDAKRALDDARAAYYDDELVTALDHLKNVANLQGENALVPIPKRVELALWQAAVQLALQNPDGAAEAARAALALSPQIKVNRRVFPPSVKRLVEKVQAAGLPLATVIITGPPADTQLEVDGRMVGLRFQVPLGRHYLNAGSASQAFDVTGDMSLNVKLTKDDTPKPDAPDGKQTRVKLDEATMAKLKSIVERGQPDPKTLLAVQEKLDTDALVIVIAQRVAAMERRAYVWQPTVQSLVSLSYPRTKDGEATLLFWIEREVKKFKPVERKGKKPPKQPRTPGAVAISVQAGGLFMQRTRGLIGGGVIDAEFAGAGARVQAQGGWNYLYGDLDLELVSYGFSTVQTILADGTPRSVTGGTSSTFRGGVGGRYELAELLTLTGTLGGSLYVHKSDDFFDSSGDLNLLTGYSWFAFDVRAGARFRPIEMIEVSAVGGLQPFGSFSEDPEGVTGANPSPSIGLTWEAGVAVTPLDRWMIQASYLGGMRSVQFEGRAAAPVSPAIVDAELSEMYHGASLTVRRLF